MKNTNKKKISLITEINNLSSESISTTVIDYTKVTSLELKQLRKALFNKDIKAKILKNTLTKKALLNSQKELIPYINGQTLLVFSKTEISIPIKIIKDYAQKATNLKIKAIYVYGKIFKDEGIQQIINLKSKEHEITKIIKYIEMPISKLINVLKIIIEKKE
jgi:large subunit ribosomal protein L10